MRNRIRELRKSRGWSQEQLGKAVVPAISRQYVSQLETRDVRGFTVDLVVKLAEALGCARDDVIGLPDTAAPEATPVPTADMPDIDILLAKLLYPQGDAETMLVRGKSMVLAGLAPGMRVLVDRQRQPEPDNRIIAGVRDTEKDTAETILRVYRPPFLLPAAADTRHTTYSLDDPRIDITGVIVACYCQSDVLLRAVAPLRVAAATAA